MLKNVLSLLLSKFYSKKESGEVAHQALPSTNGTYLFSNKSVSNWGTVSTGVAPYDGFLVLNANGDGTSDSASIFVSTPCVKSMVTFPFPSAGCSTWAPIAKGEAWAVQGSNAKQISLELCKTIGEGYQTLKKLILQGGGLCCLKHSYSSLRRSSWLARRSGWLISRLIFLRPLQKLPSLLTENATPSQCLTRASWFCNVTASCLQDLTDLTWSISEREQTATSAFLFIPRKATLFLTRLANPTTSEPQTCTSIRLTVANNLSIGGVSC